MKTILITLSGTHGTGKSTNAGRVYHLFNECGWKFSYLRHQDILDPFGFVVRRAAWILGLTEHELGKKRPLRVLWAIYILFVYFPILICGIKLRQLCGYNVVCDRYIFDTLVGFRGNETKIPMERLVLWIIPIPQLSFVLDAPEERILANRPEHTAEYIRKEQRLYQLVADRFHLKRVSTAYPVSVIWQNMRRDIEAALSASKSQRDLLIQQKVSK